MNSSMNSKQWIKIGLLVIAFFVPLNIMALGGQEVFADFLYGVEFPEKLRDSQTPPDPVHYGRVHLRGSLVSLGNVPFTRAALKVNNAEGMQYYLLPENFGEHPKNSHAEGEPLEDHVHSDNSVHIVSSGGIVDIQADLSIVANYLINNQLASVEYHLTNVVMVEE